ncbi:hypothetical protein STRIP9103_08785 [Streptomyces ipomoeae 91-03]|uniref:Uncharacterized protein n=1 Tax=Streptomyces ipomoeae 91-03 TaxID=698759 RepID=L1KHJ7_9ACTN|nr:hypothetical protein STRIP9103_08785 [Streptomyces ipomoeae 91-03]
MSPDPFEKLIEQSQTDAFTWDAAARPGRSPVPVGRPGL